MDAGPGDLGQHPGITAAQRATGLPLPDRRNEQGRERRVLERPAFRPRQGVRPDEEEGAPEQLRAGLGDLHIGPQKGLQTLHRIVDARRELRQPGFLGSVLRMLDKKGMQDAAGKSMSDLGIGTIQNMTQAVETLSGGQRQCVAVARAAAFAEHVVILDEPTAALGVKEGNMVLELIRRVRDKGLPVILISHNMPHVFEIADRIHVARLGKRGTVLNPKKISMSDTVAVMTGALRPEDLPAEALAL